MTQPLDFSSVGKKPPAEPTEKPLKQQPEGGDKPRWLLPAGVLAGAAILVAVVLTVFGGDGDGEGGDAARYCVLAGELDRVAVDLGAASSPGLYDGSADKLKAVVAKVGATFPELREVAPKPTRDDVRVVTEAIESSVVAGTGAPQDPGVVAASLRARSFQALRCASAGGATDGD